MAITTSRLIFVSLSILAATASGRSLAQQRPALLEPPTLRAGAGPIALKAKQSRTEMVIPGFADAAGKNYNVKGVYYYEATPAGASRPLAYPNFMMAPTIKALRGEEVKIDFSSDLDRHTNLHAHGLIVSPKRHAGRYGDCVLPLLRGQAENAANAHAHSTAAAAGVDPCDTANPVALPMFGSNAVIRYGYRIAGSAAGPYKHPRGVMWYHPHPHHLSEGQLAGGLSGLIVVGDPRLDFVGSPGQDLTRIPVRTIGLKDVKLVRGETETAFRFLPFTSEPENAFWQTAYKDLACAPAAAQPNQSWCDLVEGLVDGDNDPPRWKFKDGKWLFLVNGMAYPHAELAADGSEIWRIANMSADVTYRLQLVEDGNATPLRVRVLSYDGVNAPNDGKSRWVNDLVLMPSARVEVLVNYCEGRHSGAADVATCMAAPKSHHAVLKTIGLQTGVGTDGDIWPAMNLMDVDFTSAQKAISKATGFRVLAGLQQPADMLVAPQISAATKAAPTTPSACAPLAATEIRVIRFNNGDLPSGDEHFGIFAKPATAPGDVASILNGTNYPAPSTLDGYPKFDPAHDPVCLQKASGRAYRERWLLINDSKECHNFHIHQMRFAVKGYKLSSEGGAANDACFKAGLSETARAVDAPVLSPDHGAMHDNFPLPPKSRVLVELDFSDPAKRGRYVFHCHILEHEDKGMMALVDVK